MRDIKLKFVEQTGDGYEINIEKWTAPFDTCQVGIHPVEFFSDWLTDYIEWDYKTMEYGILKMTISFLETFEIADEEELKEMKAFCQQEFPLILVMMNINGSLCCRTK